MDHIENEGITTYFYCSTPIILNVSLSKSLILGSPEKENFLISRNTKAISFK